MFFQLETINKSFDGLKALDDISFGINQGEIIGQIGPNGSGKTTLFNIISGYFLPDRGNIVFKNQNITKAPAFKRAKAGIGRLFQEVRVFTKLTVLENILLARRKNRVETVLTPFLHRAKLKASNQQDIEKSADWLQFVGLNDKANSLAESLSFGQKKLLSLAMVLAAESELLLLDEPTAGLDPEITHKILELIKELRELGKAIIIIEHEFNRIFNLTDRIVLLSSGKKIYEGRPDQLKNSSILKQTYLGNYAGQ